MQASEEDEPVKVPSLESLAIEAVADPIQLQSIVKNDFYLPHAMSAAVFERCLEDYRRTKSQNDLNLLLQHYCFATRLPLMEIYIPGCELSDKLLANLLHAQSHFLKHVDITNCTGVTGAINGILEARKTCFTSLVVFKASSVDILNTVIRKRARKLALAGLDLTRNVPVLGEEDLQGGEQASLAAAAAIQGTGVHRASGSSTSSSGEPESEGSGEKRRRSSRAEDYGAIEVMPFITRAPRLRHLVLAKDPRLRRQVDEDATSSEEVMELLCRLVTPLLSLTSLDISNWTMVADLRALRVTSLTVLTLYDVPDLYNALDTLCSLTELRFLDISQSSRETGTYPKPCTALYRIASSLPNLTHLDISMTNLGAQPSSSDCPYNIRPAESVIQSDIYALRFLARPLLYLGLFNCNSASHFNEIPAEVVAGNATENQVITALQRYAHRPVLLQAVLNESYQLYRFGNNNPLERHEEALQLVLEAMAEHLNDSILQISGSAALFYILRRVNMNRNTKKQVVGALLSGMETHIEEQVMVRNCCLSLCQFEIPQEILFDYSRLAILLVTVLQHHNSDSLTQRIVVFLLNSMACHVEGDQKIQVGSYGAIEMILKQIERKLQALICDDVMEVGWSFLWNITDETPPNCERFLKADGLKLFERCFGAFRMERELTRNMMGLVGNIAEVDTLRKQLMKDEYIDIFLFLLELVDESIEISYNSAGVLAHLASDGDEAWQELTRTREDVMALVMQAIGVWSLDTRRFINYRSFRPILRLLPQFNAYASQHWAVWALANLTTTDGERYCSYVVNEGGESLLISLCVDSKTLEDTKRLAEIVLKNILDWRNLPKPLADESAAEEIVMDLR